MEPVRRGACFPAEERALLPGSVLSCRGACFPARKARERAAAPFSRPTFVARTARFSTRGCLDTIQGSMLVPLVRTKNGALQCTKFLTCMYAALDSGPANPEVLLKIDLSNAFNTHCCRLTLDVCSSKASRDYACEIYTGLSVKIFAKCSSIFEACAPPTRTCGTSTRLGTKGARRGGAAGRPTEVVVFRLSIHSMSGMYSGVSPVLCPMA